MATPSGDDLTSGFLGMNGFGKKGQGWSRLNRHMRRYEAAKRGVEPTKEEPRTRPCARKK